MPGVLVAIYTPHINGVYNLVSLFEVEGNQEKRISVRTIEEVVLTIGFVIRITVPLIGVDENKDYIIRLEHTERDASSERIKARKFVESDT